MDILRRGLIVMIAVLLLPWGAWGATVKAQGPRVMPDHAVSADAATLTTPAKKCRIAALAGMVCGPDMVASATTLDIRTRTTVTEPFPTDTWRAANRPQAPPTDPPRFS